MPPTREDPSRELPPHYETHPNLKRWEEWAEAGETAIMRERMCATDEDACGLREVSPMAGFLTDAQRLAVIRWEREHYEA